MPFKVANDNVENMSGQPVSNMWNSMAFTNRATGREVVKLFIQYPVKDNILLLDEPAIYFPNAFRRPSGTDSISGASSDASNARADTRGLRRGPGHDTIMAESSWRRGPVPPTPSRTARGPAFNGISMTPFDRRPSPQQPDFAAQSGSPRAAATPTTTPSTFTTPDEQTLNAFQGFQAMGQQTGIRQSPANGNARGAFGSMRSGFRAARDGRGRGDNVPGHTNVGQPAMRGGFQGGRTASPRLPTYHTQTEQYHSSPGSGLGVTLPTGSPGSKQGPQSAGRFNNFSNAGAGPQMPSPANTSFGSPHDPFSEQQSPYMHPQARMAGQATVKLHNAISGGNLAGAPMTAHPVMGVNGPTGTTQNSLAPAVRPTSPVKHSRSMPNMLESPTPRLDAKASEFVPKSEKKPAMKVGGPLASHPIKNKTNLAELNRQSSLNDLNKPRDDRSNFHTWLADTPTHNRQTALQALSPNPSLVTETTISPTRLAMMKPADRIEYFASQIRVKELEAALKKAAAAKAEIEVDEAKYLEEQARMQLKIAGLENNIDRGDLASSTKDDDSVHSPNQPSKTGSDEHYRVLSVSANELNDHYPTPMTAQSAQVPDEEPVAWLGGKPLGTARQLIPTPAETTSNSRRQPVGHRRDQSSEEGYTSSYDARMVRNVDDLVKSPSNSSKSRRPDDLNPTPIHPAPTWNNGSFPTPQHRAPPRMAPLLHKARAIENLSGRNSVSSKCNSDEMLPSPRNSDSSGSDGKGVCYGEDHLFVKNDDYEADVSDDSRQELYSGGGVDLDDDYYPN